MTKKMRCFVLRILQIGGQGRKIWQKYVFWDSHRWRKWLIYLWLITFVKSIFQVPAMQKGSWNNSAVDTKLIWCMIMINSYLHFWNIDNMFFNREAYRGTKVGLWSYQLPTGIKVIRITFILNEIDDHLK